MNHEQCLRTRLQRKSGRSARGSTTEGWNRSSGGKCVVYVCVCVCAGVRVGRVRDRRIHGPGYHPPARSLFERFGEEQRAWGMGPVPIDRLETWHVVVAVVVLRTGRWNKTLAWNGHNVAQLNSTWRSCTSCGRCCR